MQVTNNFLTAQGTLGFFFWFCTFGMVLSFWSDVVLAPFHFHLWLNYKNPPSKSEEKIFNDYWIIKCILTYTWCIIYDSLCDFQQ